MTAASIAACVVAIARAMEGPVSNHSVSKLAHARLWIGAEAGVRSPMRGGSVQGYQPDQGPDAGPGKETMSCGQLVRGSVLVAIVLASLLTRPDGANAGVTDRLYDDVKTVIQDLITDEVARQLLPRLACYGRHSEIEPSSAKERYAVTIKKSETSHTYSLDLLQHFPDTAYRISSRQYGLLRSSIRREAEDYAAYVLYQSVATLVATVRLRKELRGNADKQQAAVRFQQLLFDEGTLDEDLVRQFALADLARGSVKTLDIAAIDGSKPKAVFEFNSSEVSACVSQVTARMKGEDFAESQTTPLDEVCGQPLGSGTEDTLTQHVLSCEIALSFRSVLRSQPESAKGHLLRAMSAVLVPQLKYAATLSQPVDSKEIVNRIGEIDEVAVELQKLLARTDVAPPDLVPLARMIGLPTDDSDTGFKQLKSFVKILTQVWKLADTRDGRIDLASLIDALTATGLGRNPLSGVCATANATTTCNVWRSLHTQLGSAGKLWGLVTSVPREDHRHLAHQVITLLFDKFTTEDCSSTNRKNEFEAACRTSIYRRFMEALAISFVDPTSEPSSESGRESFRFAAEDVVRDLALGGGIDRGPSWTHVIVPDLELQATWSKGYVIAGADQFRYTAAVRWISWRPVIRYSQSTYLALHLSALDLLAPFGEIAERSADATYDESGRLFANVFSPRVEMVYGAPRFSKHLLLGVGVSVRPYVPVVIGGTEEHPEVEYQTYGGRTNDRWRFVDFGVFLKFKI